MDFDYRAGVDSGIMFMDDYKPKMSLSQTIEMGDEVILKVNGDRVNVIVDSINNDAYEGTVNRIIDDSDKFEDLQIGDQVEFLHSNIWVRHRS